jgi:hypothetical protein
MTKLVLVLAVVVVVILVVVIVAVRNMRTEDPDEFADRGDGRGRAGGNRDDRDLDSRRRESAGRQPARAGRGARPAGGPASGHSAAGRQGNGTRPAGASRGYDADEGFDQPYDDRRSAPVASGPQKRRRPEGGMEHRPESPAPARTRRRSGDSSEWDSSEWEQLSDVDYWTELASSKPMTAGAQPAKRGGAAAGPDQDPEPETLAVRTPAPGGVPRRDPVTGLPVRGPQPADAELTAAAGRTDFVPAPVPVAGTQERQRPPAASNGDRGSRHHRRPPAGQNGDRGQTSRQLPPAAPASGPGQRFLDAPGRDSGSYLDVGPASMPMPAIRDVPLAPPAPPARQGWPRDIPAAPPAAAVPPAAQAPPARRTPLPGALDDDPLTSPSFPKVPASDSRSYRNGRVDTPPGGSRAPAPYPAATPQLPSYDPPTAQYPGAQYSAAQYPTAQYPTAQYAEAQYAQAQYPEAQYPEAQYPTAQYPTVQPSVPRRSGQHSAPQAPQRSAPEAPAPQRRAPGRPAAQHSAPQYPGDASRGDPSGYRPDPLPSRNPYPAPVANGSPGPATTPPGPAPAAPAAAGNPYGSYVTPDSGQAPASGYNSYPATPGNGHGQPYQPPAVPGGTGQNGNGYWQPAPGSGSLPAPGGGSSYPEAAAQASEPRHADVQGPGYRNGYGQHGQADYPPNGYPADPANPAGYAPVDPYGSDGYGGYPEYGAAER